MNIERSHIIIVGYMGSGKSTLGKLIANELAMPFVDLDEYLVKKTSLSISTIFETKGELYFRDLEHQCLRELLDMKTPTIISLGGGTPCSERNADLVFKDYTSIYLKYESHSLAKRLYPEKAARPIIAGYNTQEELEQFIEEHLSQRAMFYERAELIIEDSIEIRESINQVKNYLQYKRITE